MSNKLTQHLADVMRAESWGLDVEHTSEGIKVFAMRNGGGLYEIGSVSAAAAAQDPEGTTKAIERIKYALPRKATHD